MSCTVYNYILAEKCTVHALWESEKITPKPVI
jgi:hypothetical protein